MSDALVSPAVAGVTAIISVGLISVAILMERRRDSLSAIPLMGVMGAFLFVAQMLNFAIPGTGFGGHIVGGVLLAAIIGPWRGFLTLTAVLVIQCLLFADGGVLALGCNIINMSLLSTLIAYPLIFKPMVRPLPTIRRLLTASITASAFALAGAAFMAVVETSISGVTLLSFTDFLLLMVPIHLVIGALEGMATAGVLSIIQKTRPMLLDYYPLADEAQRYPLKRMKWLLAAFSAFVLLGATWFYRYASTSPDGLEWSLAKLEQGTEEALSDAVHSDATKLQEATALMPDYENRFSGLVGSGIVLVVIGVIFALISNRRKRCQTPIH